MLFMLTVCDHLKDFLSIEFLFDFHFQNDSGSASVLLFANINCTFMFAIAQAKYVFNVSVSFLSSGLSLFHQSRYLLFLCSACLGFAFLSFACLSFACLTLLVTVLLISVL